MIPKPNQTKLEFSSMSWASALSPSPRHRLSKPPPPSQGIWERTLWKEPLAEERVQLAESGAASLSPRAPCDGAS